MGNIPSSSQVGRRPSQYRKEEDTFHGSHRNPERSHSRHCFVIRSQRPPKRECVLDAGSRYGSPTSCCCPPLPPVTPARKRCCCSSPPDPVRQRSSGNKSQGCGGQAARRLKVCHPDAYPVPEILRTRQMGLHPLAARCDCGTAAADQEEAAFFEPEPQAEISHSDSVGSFQPAVQAVYAGSQEHHDPYYPCAPRQARQQEVDPLGNFDLNRFDRDATHRGPGGRRRNVSIRTCLDYDYEPEYPPAQSFPRHSTLRSPPGHPPPQSPPGYPPPGYPPPRSYRPPAYAPRTRPPPPSWQRSNRPRAHPGSYENEEIEFVKCPYR
ncbi:formin-like protein 16 [Drosophila rhopaloa]|uniref:Formin-like protein 16 n=1 Tax=Drosophila rhopaloa TaxID=1041015 RepID=A0A6P4F514_DRORH|nr:formin-like protein 16 [Drosophila rhopaloa]